MIVPYCLFDTDKYEGYGQSHPSCGLSFGDSTVRMHSQLTISNTMALRRSSEKSRIWCQVLHYAVSSVNRSNIKFQVRTRDRRIAGIFFLSVKPTLFLKTPAFLTSSSHTLGIRLYNPTSKFVQTLGDFVRCQPKGVKALDLFRILSGHSLYLVTSTLTS